MYWIKFIKDRPSILMCTLVLGCYFLFHERIHIKLFIPPQLLERAVRKPPTHLNMGKSKNSSVVTNRHIVIKDPIPNGRCDGCYKWEAETFIEPPQGFCSTKENRAIDLLIMITSAPKMTTNREILRQFYTKDLDQSTRERIRVIFIFGKSLDTKGESIVLRESEKYGDVIKFDIPDSYYTMYPMHTNGLKWVQLKCNNTRFTVKMVDDAVLNVHGILTLLEKYGSTQLQDVVFGHCLARTKPFRKSRDRFAKRWIVSMEEYPYPVYPNLCGGSGIFMSLTTGKALLNETSNIRYVTSLDDLDIGINARLSKRCICRIPGIYYGYIGSQEIVRRLKSPEAKVDCKKFPLRPFLGVHMWSTTDPSWLRHVLQYRTCYKDWLPAKVICPQWGNCPEDYYHLPNG